MLNTSNGHNSENEGPAYATISSHATTGIGFGVPSFVYPATDYQPPPSHGAVFEWPYSRLPQPQAATSAPAETTQVSARHHDDAAYRHRDAARCLSYNSRPSPCLAKENELDPSACTVAPGGEAHRQYAADDVLRMHDIQDPDAEQRRYDVRTSPSDIVSVEATLRNMVDRHRGPASAETTRLSTRAPPPVLAREDWTSSTFAHATPRSSEQHTVYARAEHGTEPYDPLYLPTATFHQAYNDLVGSDAVPRYFGSPSSSSVSSIGAAVEAPYELGAPVNMGLWDASTVPEPTPVQLSAYQLQAASVPSALFPANPTGNQFASTRADRDTSPVNLLNPATGYNPPFGNHMHEVFAQMPTHDSGRFAPEQLAEFSSSESGADLYYAQDVRLPHVAASHTQPYHPRFSGSSGVHRPHQVSDVHAERQHELAFAVGGFSHHDHQEGYNQSFNNTARPIQSPTLPREAYLRGAQAADLPLACPTPYSTRYQGPALYPGKTSYDGFAATYSVGRGRATGQFCEKRYGSTEGRKSYFVPVHSPSTDGSSSYTYPQATFVQVPNIPRLRKVDHNINVSQIPPYP